ncbi:MAG: family 78 glycoside hydrolase catalytic domain, partial [Oscillospiraceae bacterium]|nr:family 78 glycoside hydrolase catalytic domain [Oscillospiraceae bacterium]
MVKSSSLRKRALSCLLTAALLLAMLGGVAAPFASAAGGITTAAGGITTAADGATSVTNLKVNALENPLGIDTTEPEFSWNMESNVIGQAQTSYRIQVSLNSTFTNLAWDSGEVSSNTSVGIFYDGDSLIPETNYWWRVTVIDFFGQEIVSDTAFFSTGVMEPNRDAPAWNGAKFIGSDVKPLDAATMRYWRISMSFEVVEGDNFSVILGADDFRLTDPFQNQFNTAGGENFVRVEIDGIGTDSANLNIYRVGYDSSDSVSTAGQPVDAYTQPLKTLSSAAFRNLFNAANASRVHTIDIACQDSSIATLNLDGTNFVTGYTVASGRVAAASNANISPYNTFSSVGGNRSFTANNAAPTYPNLASVGFQVNNVGDKVLVTNYRLRENVKNNSALVGGTGSVNNNRDFLNADTSVSYEIFDALDGVSVSGGVITVNPTAAGELGPKYTDPSYGAHPMLRSSFTTKDKAIADAKMYITAMGTYDMYINGRRMTEDSHNPGQSDYNHTIFYHTYDVKDLLIENADNAMGAYLAEDFWSGYDGPSEYRVQGDVEALFCKLAITYADGSTDIIVTDPANWKVWTDGPIRIGSNLMGERYDARYAEGLVDKGLPIEQVWATAGFDDSAWPKAVEMPIDKRNPGALSSGYALMNPELHARQDLPVHTIDTLTAVGVLNTHSVDGHTWTYDMGVNMVGVPEVTIPAGDLEEGDVVILRFGEVIYPGNTDSPNTHHPNGTSYESLYGPAGLYRPGVAGRILTETYRSALSADFYVASAYDETHDVTFSPTFTFHGYRYVQITIPHRTTALPANNVRGFFKSSLETLSGAYNAVTIGNSGDLINKLFLNTQRSTYANYFSVPTDCPQRNEREGWTGDTEVFARSAAFHGDNQTFLRTWMKSLRDVQYKGTATSPAGAVPDRVPRHVLTGVLGEAFTSPGIFWACAVVMVPYQLYSQFGDVKVIRENMGAIKLWLEAHASSYQVAGYPGLTSLHSGNADHVSIDTRSATAIVNNACMVYMLKLAAEMADVIGDPYADTLYARHAQAVDSWNRAFIDPNTGLARNATVNASGVSSFTVCDSQTAYSLAINFGIISDTMTIQSGDNAGKTYKEFAVTRLAQLAANPKLSGNSGPNGSGSTANCPPYTITTGFA